MEGTFSKDGKTLSFSEEGSDKKVTIELENKKKTQAEKDTAKLLKEEAKRKEQEEMKTRAAEYRAVKDKYLALEKEMNEIKKQVKKDQIKAIKKVCKEYGITATNLKGGLKTKKKKKEEEA